MFERFKKSAKRAIVGYSYSDAYDALFNVEFYLRRATDVLGHLKLVIQADPEKLETVEKKWKEEQEDLWKRMRKGAEVPRDKLSEYEKKLWDDLNEEWFKKQRMLDQVKIIKSQIRDIGECGHYVARYCRYREKIDYYEKDREGIQKTVDRHPELKGVMLSLNMKLSTFYNLEQEIFSHPFLRAMLSTEYQKRFRERSE